jgi:hypothetical protein
VTTSRLDRDADARAQLDATTRWGMAMLAALLAVVLALARWLEPDPRGFGTHRQLGLPACQFASVTGRPCPSCGMTTAFAWFVRGRLDQAWRANPAGSLLAPTVAALAPWLLAGAVRGRPLWARSPEPPLLTVAVVAVAVSLAFWVFRLVVAW